jgi:hypothetical protein
LKIFAITKMKENRSWKAPWIFLRWSNLMQQISVFQHCIIKLLTLHDTILSTNIALIVSTLYLDFSFDHILFIMENILSAGAVLPGRQRINSIILLKSWKSRHFPLILEKNLYPSIRYRNVFFIPCIQQPHNFRFYEGPLIAYTSFFCFCECGEFLVQAVLYFFSFRCLPY